MAPTLNLAGAHISFGILARIATELETHGELLIINARKEQLGQGALSLGEAMKDVLTALSRNRVGAESQSERVLDLIAGLVPVGASFFTVEGRRIFPAMSALGYISGRFYCFIMKGVGDLLPGFLSDAYFEFPSNDEVNEYSDGSRVVAFQVLLGEELFDTELRFRAQMDKLIAD